LKLNVGVTIGGSVVLALLGLTTPAAQATNASVAQSSK
jgi:hypothetical protein